MLHFHCSACGKQVQGDESLAGKSVLCPVCNAAMAAPATPSAVTATPPHAARAGASSTGFREGLPPSDAPVPSIGKEAPHFLMRWMPVMIGATVVLTIVGLLVPAVQKVREAAARTQSHGNLKQIGLACHSFSDANKQLPYNGTAAPYQFKGVTFGGPAIAGDKTTGSWAFMILPFIDQGPMFVNNDTGTGVFTFMCPGRGRPSKCIGAGGPGAWTDYSFNSFLNHPNGDFNAQDRKRTLVGITDGTSNTILVGHGQMKPADYAAINTTAGFTDIIFNGGSRGLCRPNRAVVNSVDSDTAVAGNWGSPFSHGSLMCMADGTVRMFPYSVTGGTIRNGENIPIGSSTLGAFLTPNGGDNAFPLPDT